LDETHLVKRRTHVGSGSASGLEHDVCVRELTRVRVWYGDDRRVCDIRVRQQAALELRGRNLVTLDLNKFLCVRMSGREEGIWGGGAKAHLDAVGNEQVAVLAEEYLVACAHPAYIRG
jgi:hypothetical protein